mgnify:CR=1 FL=1
MIDGTGGVHHIWGCDHFKTTLNASEYKRVHRRRANMVKDAMDAAASGTREQLVDALVRDGYRAHYALRGEGFLVLGESETLETQEFFRVQDKKHCIYRRRNVRGPERNSQITRSAQRRSHTSSSRRMPPPVAVERRLSSPCFMRVPAGRYEFGSAYSRLLPFL